ncbi:hypothetical protein BDM02DRAFT_2831233 [Thelephora ganbajun]|uniref:Uncharacterized protein n=1 Tax=Thelephora ganbajun TaxID=370292 RepID=A0ACB6ZC84_THEGA|nr:hypothetical protein BDM02DRAFT_2831233 [Thelephora ganbajun]
MPRVHLEVRTEMKFWGWVGVRTCQTMANKYRLRKSAALPFPRTFTMHPPSEKSPLLRIGIPTVNIIPFPQIVTPASTHHSSYPHPSESPRSPLSPPASILIESRRYLPRPAASSSSRRNSSWPRPPFSLPEGITLPAFIQASLSGAASLLGWDMVTGCILYAPNEPLRVLRNIFPNPTPPHQVLGMKCSASSVYGILLSVALTVISSLVYFRSQPRSKPTMLSGLESGRPSFKANFATFVMAPMACLLASIFTALIILVDVRANIGTVCHLGSALCTSIGIIATLLIHSLRSL